MFSLVLTTDSDKNPFSPCKNTNQTRVKSLRAQHASDLSQQHKFPSPRFGDRAAFKLFVFLRVSDVGGRGWRALPETLGLPSLRSSSPGHPIQVTLHFF